MNRGQGAGTPVNTTTPPPGMPSGGSLDDKAKYRRVAAYKMRAMGRRDNWIPAWEECLDYVFPYREGYHNETPGQRKTDFIYDETAVTGAPRSASRLLLGVFPPNGETFNLSPGPTLDPDYQTPMLDDGLREITGFMHDCLRNSNFSSELHEALQDILIGTMTMLVEPGKYPGDLVFTAVPTTHHALLPGKKDDIGGWFRWQDKTCTEIRACWPKAKWSAEMEQAEKQWKAGGGEGEEPKFRMVEAVLCTEAYDDEEPEYEYYLLCETHQCICDQHTYKGEGSNPFITARWSKNANEVWGRGPLLQAMPAIKTVNLTVQLILENAEMAIGGVYVYDNDGIFNPNNVTLQPGAFLPKAKGSEVAPLQSPAQFDVAQLVLNDMRRNIRKALFIDELEKEGSTPISAEEVTWRMRDVARDMGSVASRLMGEFLKPLVQRIRYILQKQGILKLPRINGKELRLVPTSPLLRVQEQQEVDNVLRFGQTLDMMFGPGMSAMSWNKERARPWLAEKMSIPSELLNNEVEEKVLMDKTVAAATAAPEGAEKMIKAMPGQPRQ